MATPALSLREVGFTYPAFPWGVGWLMGRRRGPVDAVRTVSFQLAAGERACLMGPNGAGKTTLLKLLLGFLQPTSGAVLVHGEPARGAGARRLGFVHPDERSFYWRLTVMENLAFFGGLWGLSPAVARERAEAVSEELSLGPALRRPFGQLSTGMRQKVAIARALLHRPDVLLMDEPTRSLDPPSAARLRQWLSGPAFAGRALLIATHNVEEASRLGPRCLVMARGRVVHDGPLPSGGRLFELMEAPE